MLQDWSYIVLVMQSCQKVGHHVMHQWHILDSFQVQPCIQSIPVV